MSPEFESIASIGGIGGLLIGAAWQIRKMLASDSRQITNDNSAQKWQEQQNARIERLEAKLDERDLLVRAADKMLSECRAETRGLEESNFQLNFRVIAYEKEIAAKEQKIAVLAGQLRKYLP